MTRERPIAVELEIDVVQPLSGRLREHGGTWRGFAGWIGLAGAIDEVVGRAGDSRVAADLAAAARAGGAAAPPAAQVGAAPSAEEPAHRAASGGAPPPVAGP